MKIINVVCKQGGRAIVTTDDIHISSEHRASKIVIDFSANTDYVGYPKWLDLVHSNGTSIRLDLGNDEIIEYPIEKDLTYPGELTITPIIMEFDSDDVKVKFIPNQKISILYQPETGELAVVGRDDYIKTLKDELDEVTEFKNQFKFYSATEFAEIVREENKIYGVYSELSGEITWYYGNEGI